MANQITLNRPYFDPKTDNVIIFTDRIPPNEMRPEAVLVTEKGDQIPEQIVLAGFRSMDIDQTIEKDKLLRELSSIDGFEVTESQVKNQNSEPTPKLTEVTTDELGYTQEILPPKMTNDTNPPKTTIYSKESLKILQDFRCSEHHVQDLEFNFHLPDLTFMKMFFENMSKSEGLLGDFKEYFYEQNEDLIKAVFFEWVDKNLSDKKSGEDL